MNERILEELRKIQHRLTDILIDVPTKEYRDFQTFEELSKAIYTLGKAIEFQQ